MKKLFFYAAIMASAFFAASCQQEMLETQAGSNTVTYTVDVPNAIATKAIGDQITAVDKVYFEVYRAAEVNDLSKSPVYQGEKSVINNSASFPLEFVKGQEFVVLFWAQNSALVNTDVTSDAGMYNINDLRKIQLVNPGAANNEAAQVFAGSDRVSNCASAANGNVTLTRPVSQINVYTTTESLSFGDVTIGLSTSDMTVAGLYNTYNVATGDAVEADENESRFVYAEAAVPTATADNAALKYVAMNYVGFAPKNGTTVKVDFNIQTTEAVKIKHSVSNVPVKPNFRTNITGNLITATSDYNISLNDKWSNAEITYATNAEAAQAALDNATAGTVIKLHPGVNYGTLIFRNTASSKVVDITTAGGDERGNEKYRRIEDLTIIGAEGAIVDGFDFQAGFVPGSGASFIDIKNFTVKNVTFSGNMTPFKFEGFALGIDGLNIVDCKMIDADNNDRFVFQQMNGYKVLNDKSKNEYVMTSGIKNLTITGCEIIGAHQVIESRAMENLAITNNTFRGIKARDMLITSDVSNFPDKTYTGYVKVTGNQSFDGEERFVRASLNNSDAVVVIKDNNIYNYKGADADYIKVSGGNNVTIENNVFAKFVYGLTIIPNGENSMIIVKDKEGFLNLTRLFADWTRLFTDGNGNEWVNYANGAGADYYFRDYWTISLEADIDLNNDTIDPVILKHPVSTGVLTFDGNNNTIKNAIIVTDATTENAAGLFDASHHDALKNLRLDNIHVTGSNVGNSSAGVLSGSVSEDVQNITITNSSVTGGKYTGGIIGNGYTDVTNCSLTNVTVKGGYKLGGVIGYICASSGTGDVTGNTLTDCTVDGIGGGVYAGGKSEYIIGKVVGNYNCNGVCSNNTITNMTTSATANIGKVEVSFTVQE